MIRKSILPTVDENIKIWISVASDYGQKAWRRYQLANVLHHLSRFRPLSSIMQKKASVLYDEADLYFEMAQTAFRKSEFR